MKEAERKGGDRRKLLELLRTRSLRRGDFLLSSGARSSYYIDGRKTTMSGEGQRLIGRLGLRAIHDVGWHPGAVGGLTLGADPVAYAIAHAAEDAPLDGFTVRKQPKQHGTGQRIEGGFEAGMDVVVVEDVMTSGASAMSAVDAVREAGGRVLGVFCVVDREEGGHTRLSGEGLQLVALFTAAELLASD